jgi:hypothetical protein
MIHISPESGRNDNIHGDEQYREHLGAEAVDLYDVIFAIRDGASTHDGHSHHDWIRRICEGDEITSIMQRIIKDRHNPAFAEIMNDIEAAIEGWLP